MFLLKKLIFKFMELGLGLRTCFSLETKDPVFVNFKLSAREAEEVRKALPPRFTLDRVRFCDGDESPEYWISYNLYDIKYPKKELQGIKRARCEINTFVRDPAGRKGILVFCGSPYVSKEARPSLMGRICELAERMVIFIYGCGRLIPLIYELSSDVLRIEFEDVSLRLPLPAETAGVRLSDEYAAYNDISFFNHGKTFDLVNTSSSFPAARFQSVEGAALEGLELRGPFFRRAPDKIYYHRGDIAYLVNALNQC